MAISKYHSSHVGVVTFVNVLQGIARFVKSALAPVCNVRLNDSIRWKDDDLFVPIFHMAAEVLCFIKKLAKFFTTMFHFTSLYGNGGTKFLKKKAERQLACPQAAQLDGAIRKRPATSPLHSPKGNWGILVRTDWPFAIEPWQKERVDGLVCFWVGPRSAYDKFRQTHR